MVGEHPGDIEVFHRDPWVLGESIGDLVQEVMPLVTNPFVMFAKACWRVPPLC
ncbi:MAG: hypothetical protein Q8P61_08840 [Candidatus Nanopelagicales bacterium]|nr:hypothetical protein [Candidatus Nanopelagicales bacterium]